MRKSDYGDRCLKEFDKLLSELYETGDYTKYKLISSRISEFYNGIATEMLSEKQSGFINKMFIRWGKIERGKKHYFAVIREAEENARKLNTEWVRHPKYVFDSSETDIEGVETKVKSEGYCLSDDSKTEIRVKPTGVWGGFEFAINKGKYEDELVIRTCGDYELYDLTSSLKWLVKKLDSIGKDRKPCLKWYDENQKREN